MLSPLSMPGRNIFAGLMPLRESETLMNRSMERLATGRAVNSASDDPAGLIAGLQLDAAIRALDAESRVLEREASSLATKDGALAAAGEMLGELEGLAVQAANSGAMSDAERDALAIEAASIVRAIEHTAGAAKFNGERLFENGLTPDIGAVAAEEGGESVNYSLADVGRAVSLFESPAIVAQIAGQASADIATMRGEIGATIANEIEPRSRAIDEAAVNLAQAHSLIVDTDYARESAALIRADILAQASRYLLALDARNAQLAVGLLGAA